VQLLLFWVRHPRTRRPGHVHRDRRTYLYGVYEADGGALVWTYVGLKGSGAAKRYGAPHRAKPVAIDRCNAMSGTEVQWEEASALCGFDPPSPVALDRLRDLVHQAPLLEVSVD